MGTTDFTWHRIESNDFYKEDISREIQITCKFSELSTAEQAAFLECLTYEKDQEAVLPCLYLNWTCKYTTAFNPPRAITNLSSGLNCDGTAPTSEARALLRVTYLKALRDANSDIQSGRHSRLSQIIQSIPNLTDGENKYADGMDLHKLSLVGIANLSNDLLASHPILSSVTDDMSQILNEKMLLKQDKNKTKFEVSDSKNKDVQKINRPTEEKQVPRRSLYPRRTCDYAGTYQEGTDIPGGNACRRHGTETKRSPGCKVVKDKLGQPLNTSGHKDRRIR